MIEVDKSLIIVFNNKTYNNKRSTIDEGFLVEIKFFSKNVYNIDSNTAIARLIFFDIDQTIVFF